jgi:hypothetical protein
MAALLLGRLDRQGIILSGENAVVFSWQNAALLLLLRRLISTRIGCSVSVQPSPRILNRHVSKPILLVSLPR